MGTINLAEKLIARGDHLAIEEGRLSLVAASGNPIPRDWLKSNQSGIVAVILKLTKVPAFEYVSYSSGKFGKHLSGGVELQFTDLLSGGGAFTIYPADVVRQKSTRHGKAGSALPKNHFRVSKRSKFYKFWLRTKLELPNRIASLHDYMGNLKPLIFGAEYVEGEKLLKDSIAPLNISHEQIKIALNPLIVPDTSPTSAGQLTDKVRTEMPDTKTPQPYEPQHLQAIQTTGAGNHGIRLIGNAVTRNYLLPVNSPIDPSEQTEDEWLADYSG